MVNLGICRKCASCVLFSPAYVGDDGRKTKRSYVECSIAFEALGWSSEIPEGCPYVLEHRLAEESLEEEEYDA